MTATRILLVNDHIYFGGGGDALFRLEREFLESSGYQVFTYSFANDSAVEQGPADHVFPGTSSSILSRFRKYAGSNSVRRHFRQVLKRLNPDLVHVHLISRYPLDIYSELAQYPVIQTLHGPNLFCATSWGNLRGNSQPCEMGVGRKCFESGCVSLASWPVYQQFYWRLAPKVKSAVDLHICPSRFIQSAAEHAGFSPTRYVPHGIDRVFSNALQRVPRFEQPSVLFVGALVEPKGACFLIDAIAIIRKHIPSVMLRICGRGPLQGNLAEQVERLGLNDNIRFMGFTERNELIDLYQRSHCLAVPSIWAEQFGLIGPESLACQTAVVASNVGGIPEWLVDGESGYLVPPRNPEALAAKIMNLLNDPDLRQSMGEFGRQFVMERFSTDDYERRLIELVNEFC